jgi:hypothetical protein
MVRCKASASPEDIARFNPLLTNIFVKLTTDGAVTDVLVAPETKLAECLRSELTKFKFSPPPVSPYWVKLE